jgi:hypothetical protein
MVFKRIVAPDTANELKHPENQSLFARFKQDSRAAAPGKNPPWTIGYEARAHSDLIPILYALICQSPRTRLCVCKATHSIFFHPREDMDDLARPDGGRYDPTYGKDWIEFRVGGRVGGSADWRESMERWASISYRDAQSIE